MLPKERSFTANTYISALFMVIIKFSSEGSLGPFFLGYSVLLRCQLLWEIPTWRSFATGHCVRKETWKILRTINTIGFYAALKTNTTHPQTRNNLKQDSRNGENITNASVRWMSRVNREGKIALEFALEILDLITLESLKANNPGII